MTKDKHFMHQQFSMRKNMKHYSRFALWITYGFLATTTKGGQEEENRGGGRGGGGHGF
jgi:hypothetical protein